MKMAGKKTTLKELFEKLDSLEDKHNEEIIDLKKTIEEQETRIKVLEKFALTDKHSDFHDKIRNNDHVIQSTMKNLEKGKKNQLNCNKCESKFVKFSDLELHIKKMHVSYKEHECDQCGKKFVTTWRLRKHIRIHVQKFTKICNYFRRQVKCPFEEFGCKFSHDVPAVDTFNDDKSIDKIGDTDISLESSISFNTDTEPTSFHTSTPKPDNHCEECQNRSQCVDCFVIQTLGGHGSKKLFL